MKTNEAPKKLWINPSMDLPKLNGVIDRDSVQYVRTDVFKKEFLKNRDSFIKELETLINQHGIDTFTDTPDFILADFLWRIIEQLENLNDKKNWWSGKKHSNKQ